MPRTLLAALALPLLLPLLAVAVARQATAEDISNGFNSKIDWKSWDDMQDFDYASNTKPILYLFNKPWCGACKRLKSEFIGKEGDKIIKLSKDFVMVNVATDIPDKSFAPDGGYIPRILYSSPKGELRTELKNKNGNPKYGYFYSTALEVEKAMVGVRDMYGQQALGNEL